MKYEMITGLSKIDLEYKLLMGEGVVFATLFLLLPVWLVLYPRLAFYAVGMDQVRYGTWPQSEIISLVSARRMRNLFPIGKVQSLRITFCGPKPSLLTMSEMRKRSLDESGRKHDLRTRLT